MRFIITILLFYSLGAKAQIIKASPNYTPFATATAVVVVPDGPDRLVDSFPSPAVAYSLRRLSKNYTGSAIKVLNVTASTSADIGFTSNGDLDTVALKSFCGNSDAAVSILYDQSGAGNNDSISGGFGGPFIAKAGVVVRDGGKPTMDFTGRSSFRSMVRNISATNISIFTVAKITTSSGGYQRLINGSPDLYFFIGANSSNQVTTFYGNGSAWGITSTQSTTTWLNTSRLVTSINNGNDNQYINGSLISSRSNPLGSWNGQIWIGGVYGAGVTNQTWNGTFSELVAYISDKSSVRTGVEGNINRYYSIY